MVAAGVLEGDGLPAAFQDAEVALSAADAAGRQTKVEDALRRFRRCPAESGTCPTVIDKGCFVHGTHDAVLAHRGLKACEDLVARNDGTPRVADDNGCLLAAAVIDGVVHGDDGIHRHILHSCQFQLGAQVVRAVAQHCPPRQGEVAAGVACLDALAGELQRTLRGCGIGKEVFCLHVVQRHCRRSHFCAVSKADAEEVVAWQQSHRFAAVEGQLAVGQGQTKPRTGRWQGCRKSLPRPLQGRGEPPRLLRRPAALAGR